MVMDMTSGVHSDRQLYGYLKDTVDMDTVMDAKSAKQRRPLIQIHFMVALAMDMELMLPTQLELPLLE